MMQLFRLTQLIARIKGQRIKTYFDSCLSRSSQGCEQDQESHTHERAVGGVA